MKPPRSFLPRPAGFNTIIQLSRPSLAELAHPRASRSQSTSATSVSAVVPQKQINRPIDLPPLSRMPTGLLLRSYVLTSIMSSRLLDPCLAAMKQVTNSNSLFLSPAKNPFVNSIIKTTIYNHFSAGSNSEEVKKSVLLMKQLGFQGVILGYAKECVVDPEAVSGETEELIAARELSKKTIEEWKEGTLSTLRMIGAGDFLAVKYTGAGPEVIDALANGKPPPKAVKEGMNEICAETARQGSRLWIDAEQQKFQKTLDIWTIDLMREQNRNGKALVFNTIQAYLKSAPENTNTHLKLAAQEGWALGIKLVRGAYIAHEKRSLVHDTKPETDQCYNLIADRLLKQKLTGIASGLKFPKVELFLAGHNAESIEKASNTHRSRTLAGDPTIPIEYGQLQGMADEISCGLLQQCEETNAAGSELEKSTAPKAYKCMTWGTTTECLGFLLRRAIENKGAVERTTHTADALRKELWRRVFKSTS